MNKSILLGAAALIALLVLSLCLTDRPAGGRGSNGSSSSETASAPGVIPAPPRPNRAIAGPATEEKAAPLPPPTDGTARLSGVVFQKKDKMPVPGVRLRARARKPSKNSGPPDPSAPADPAVVVVAPADPAVAAGAASPTAPPPPEALSGADGRFSFTLASGTYELDINDPDNEWSITRTARPALRRIELAAGDAKAVDVPVYRNRRMTGKISAAGGEKIPPKSIDINLRGSQGRDRSDVDDEGKFTLRIEDETNDRFRLEVSADGYGKVARDVAWPLETDLADQDVVLGNGVILRGLVQDPEGRPIGKIRVELIRVEPTDTPGAGRLQDRIARAESGPDGRYEIRGVPTGWHALQAGDRDWKQAEGPVGVSIPDVPVHLLPPLVLIPRGKFRGRVLGLDGQPVPAILWFPTGARRGTEKDGTFAIEEPDRGWAALFGVEGATAAELKLTGDRFKTLTSWYVSPDDAAARFHEIRLVPGTQEEAAEVVARRRYEGEREGRWWEVRSTAGIPDATAETLQPMFDSYFQQYYPLLDRFGAAKDDAGRLVVQREIDAQRELLFQSMRPHLTVEQNDALLQLFESYRRSGWPNGVPAELGR